MVMVEAPTEHEAAEVARELIEPVRRSVPTRAVLCSIGRQSGAV